MSPSELLAFLPLCNVWVLFCLLLVWILLPWLLSSLMRGVCVWVAHLYMRVDLSLHSVLDVGLYLTLSITYKRVCLCMHAHMGAQVCLCVCCWCRWCILLFMLLDACQCCLLLLCVCLPLFKSLSLLLNWINKQSEMKLKI